MGSMVTDRSEAGPTGTERMLSPFDYTPRTRIVYGRGAVESLGRLAVEYGARRVLVVSDPGIVAAGHTERGLASLRGENLATRLFQDVKENPTTEIVDAGLAVAREFEPDFLVGLGGGSSMDCAKGINFLLTNGGRMQDYQGVGRAVRAMLPMIAVPTTAGTGSETQSYALISDPETHVKMACGDPKAAFRVALLDPELTLTQPREIAALTGIDAISHAIESFVTTRRSAISQMFSRRAWQLLVRNFEAVFARPSDLDVRGGMLLGAALAGQAIETSMLGATHASANPLTARYGITHGRAIGIMLPHVVRRNAAVAGELYGELVSDVPDFTPSDRGAGETLAGLLGGLLRAARLPSTLREVGVEREMLPRMAEDATQQWTGRFNPVPLDRAGFLELYENAF